MKYIVKYAKNVGRENDFDPDFILEYRKYKDEIVSDEWTIVDKSVLFKQLEGNLKKHRDFEKNKPNKNNKKKYEISKSLSELTQKLKDLEDRLAIAEGKKPSV